MKIRHVVTMLFLAASPLLAQSPVAVLGGFGTDTLYWYVSDTWGKSAPIPLRVIASPREATIAFPARLDILDPTVGSYIATIDVQVGITPICLQVTSRRRVAHECIEVVAEQPMMPEGIDTWGAFDAGIGQQYNPSSEWLSLHIPAAHYQTIVEIDGVPRFNAQGTRFHGDRLPAALTITEATKSVRTRVYWRPNGTVDQSRWMLLASTDGSGNPAVPLGTRRMSIGPRN